MRAFFIAQQIANGLNFVQIFRDEKVETDFGYCIYLQLITYHL